MCAALALGRRFLPDPLCASRHHACVWRGDETGESRGREIRERERERERDQRERERERDAAPLVNFIRQACQSGIGAMGPGEALACHDEECPFARAVLGALVIAIVKIATVTVKPSRPRDRPGLNHPLAVTWAALGSAPPSGSGSRRRKLPLLPSKRLRLRTWRPRWRSSDVHRQPPLQAPLHARCHPSQLLPWRALPSTQQPWKRHYL